MTSQHAYNLDLDEIAKNGTSVVVMPNTLDVFASLAKQFSSFNEEFSKGIRSSLVANVAEITKNAIAPNKSLLEAFKSAMEPTAKLREQMIESFKSISSFNLPAFDVPELDYYETYDAPVILDIDADHRRDASDMRMSTALIKLPKNAKWEYMRFVIISDRDAIVYYQGKKLGQFTCEELGMARMSTSDKQPDKRFQFLYHTAIILQNKDTGVWPTTNVLATRDAAKIPTKKQLGVVHSTKRLLSSQLRETFGIDNEPILYDPKYGYQPKFSLEFISEIQVGLHDELPDPNTDKMPEDLTDDQDPIE